MERKHHGVGTIMAIDLGTISPKKVSLFKVTATTTVANVSLSYAYKNGKLPPGLSLYPDGGIAGICGDTIFELDQGNTTFDSNSTSFEKTFVFTVTATGQFGNVTDEQVFTIDVVKNTQDKISNMYAKPRPDSASLASFQSLINNTKIFTNDTQYRPYDENFNTIIPSFLMLSGVSLKLLSNIQSLLKNNSYNFKLRVGDFRLASAKDRAGNTIYEIIYSELIDPNTGANDSFTLKSHNLPDITIQLRADSLEFTTDVAFHIPGVVEDQLYSNDVVNIQNELKDGLTVNNFDYLPLWMQTPQSPVRGFRLALPIKYLQPGAGAQALYRLQNEITYDPKQLDIDIDRLILDDNLGTTFNDAEQLTYTGDGSTTVFTSPYAVTKPNHLIVTVDGSGVTDFNLITDVTADSELVSGDNSLYCVDAENPATPKVAFDTAPINTASIVIKLKPTTFGKLIVTTFDAGNTETTFDADGTRFIGEEVTFDRKQNPNFQLMFSKSAVTDGITHISKEPKLVRTV